jgi:hypothetical protein
LSPAQEITHPTGEKAKSKIKAAILDLTSKL